MQECVGIIGAGRVGRTLNRLLFEESVHISIVIDLNLERARNCLQPDQTSAVSAQLKDIPSETTILFLAVPDDSLGTLSEELSGSPFLSSELVAAHCSGLFSSDVIGALRNRLLNVCSFHPCCSITDGFEGDLKDIYIAIEGDEAGCKRLESVALLLNSKPFRIRKKDKIKYHAACVLASNYLVSLMDLAENVFPADISNTCNRQQILYPLVLGTLKNIQERGTVEALTGPISRGDFHTVKHHIESLRKHPDILSAYVVLGQHTLKLARRLNPDLEGLEAIQTLFEKMEMEMDCE
ncbi:hypothetical protein BVY01_03280 [bacterium I07]|nr:hypothetical protein BVY01_03280 [bacterium I07]